MGLESLYNLSRQHMSSTIACATEIVQALHQYHLPLSDVLISMVKCFPESELITIFANDLPYFLSTLANNVTMARPVKQWAHTQIAGECASEISILLSLKNGLHFSARQTTSAQLELLDIDELASKMENLTPHTWKMLDILHEANEGARKSRRKEDKQQEKVRQKKGTNETGDVEMLSITDGQGDESEYDANSGEDDFGRDQELEEGLPTTGDKAVVRRGHLTRIVSQIFEVSGHGITSNTNPSTEKNHRYEYYDAEQ